MLLPIIPCTMPLEPPDLRHLNAAQGFASLGMYQHANAELEEIDPFCRALPEVLEVRLDIYRGSAKWDLMQVVAEKLVQHDPGEPQWAISCAYATRRAVSIEAAKLILMKALERHPDDELIHYNLACYQCRLGELSSAKEHLKKALELQPKYRAVALDDPDLEPLWNLL